ncbi:hypothetical protein U4960_07260 [Altererythrobacter sp. H2]|uniref:hypothetical protein n=1 Tax=Altererythrobacter sp. H2 TaxID=3108391 RepID=UPI002B4BED2E|nr:hypothetical protein [Altererythrobacter sp. H2]WRK97104.1 hypothetical protein U4960_07260 [Altererythrobacter sp. H2]
MHRLRRGIAGVGLTGMALCLAGPGLAAPDDSGPARKVGFAAPAVADPLLTKVDAQARLALSARGYEIDPAAPIRIELALSRRPNDVAVRSDAGASAAQVASTPGKRRVDLCKDSIYRLVIAQVETQTGAVTYRGSAEVKRCGSPSDKDLASLVTQSLAGLR